MLDEHPPKAIAVSTESPMVGNGSSRSSDNVTIDYFYLSPCECARCRGLRWGRKQMTSTIPGVAKALHALAKSQRFSRWIP